MAVEVGPVTALVFFLGATPDYSGGEAGCCQTVFPQRGGYAGKASEMCIEFP